tara:strand:- start:2791 stop:4902 length:2112 start_codon:yes stop_codon:yes gene_type:complete
MQTIVKDTPIRYLKGVGPQREKIFNSLGVYTLRDLLYYFPFRYEDRTNLGSIKDLKVGEHSLLKGVVKSKNLKTFPYFMKKRRVKSVFEVILEDETGSVRLCWFNQGYLADTINKGDELIAYGKLYLSKQGLQVISPEFELDSSKDSLGVGRIIGVYRLPAEFSQRFMRNIIHAALDSYRQQHFDPLPFTIRRDKNFFNIAKSLEEIHFPTSWDNIKISRERFIFQELFFAQILVYLRKAKHRMQRCLPVKINQKTPAVITANFPFSLTSDQEKAISQILGDLEKPYPMHRLLQGDVGCGKTIVASFAIAVCAEAGLQVAFMVPTEVLAFQHYNTLLKTFKGLSFCNDNDNSEKIRLITSSSSKEDSEQIRKDLKTGKIRVVIGTHALIQKSIKFKSLALVVIDEQHKFGVAQRSLLPEKGALKPHCLVMSATPIPRSLALSIYGDLDLSVIKELPKLRLQPETIWVKEKKRQWVYDFIKENLLKGRQAYIIYPVIEENQDQDLKSLKVMYKNLKKEFSKFKVAMFHGRMKSDEKIKVISSFKDKKINILISTTVVEVGVNIENATVMVVENPERFGLAQLHQLRGRIQRSSHQPYFILISKASVSETADKRLKIISSESSGFKIAEEDLLLRGPGDFFGQLQHGLPDHKIANPLRDMEVLQQARVVAHDIIKNDPHLSQKSNENIRRHLDGIFGTDLSELFS